MKELYDAVSAQCSKITTNNYSTSFSLGIYFLEKKYRDPIYAIYGFVRFADEIVDTFHDYDKARLLNDFKKETYKAIELRISLNPILNSFQQVVRNYGIDLDLIEKFLKSMKMDLSQTSHNSKSFDEYVLGSAEVVGLMCLWVFCEGNKNEYEKLKPAAMKLGAAFQKVNFLRDLKYDHKTLERSYFPGLDLKNFSLDDKKKIESDIRRDFREALNGIRQLPKGARFGVYIAYVYFKALLDKIEGVPSDRLLSERLRIPNYKKLNLLVNTYLKYNIGIYS